MQFYRDAGWFPCRDAVGPFFAIVWHGPPSSWAGEFGRVIRNIRHHSVGMAQGGALRTAAPHEMGKM